MGIIQCAENCKFQNDGYCELNKPSLVNSLTSACPYFIKKSLYKGNGIGEPSDTDKLD